MIMTNIINIYDFFKNETPHQVINYNIVEDALLFADVTPESTFNIIANIYKFSCIIMYKSIILH